MGTDNNTEEKIKEQKEKKHYFGNTDYWSDFDRIYRMVLADKEPRVLSYDGLGGVGKTYLMEYFCDILDFTDPSDDSKHEKAQFDTPVKSLPAKDIKHISIELNEHSDKISILREMKDRTIEAYNGDCEFPIFEEAYNKYFGYKSETKDYKNPFTSIKSIDAILEVGGAITHPDVATILFGAKVIDKIFPVLFSFVDKLISKKKHEMLDIVNSFSHREIYDNIHWFFIYDMCVFMNKQYHHPLVIFLDNYEAYRKSFSGILYYTDDSWLRKKLGSLMHSIPNIMWVVLGRNDPWKEPNNNEPEIISKVHEYYTYKKVDALTEEEAEEFLRTKLEIPYNCDDPNKNKLITEIIRKSDRIS